MSAERPVDVMIVAYCPPAGAVAEVIASVVKNLGGLCKVALLAPASLEVDSSSLVRDIRFPYSSRRPGGALVGRGWRAHREASRLEARTVLLLTEHPFNAFAAVHCQRSEMAFWWHEPQARGQVRGLKARVYQLHDAVIAPRCKAIIVATPSLRLQVPRTLQPRTTVVPFSTMPEFGQNSGRFSDSPTDLVFFGKLAPYKGLDVLASALNVLAERQMYPSLRIVGCGSLVATAPLMHQLMTNRPTQIHHVDEYASAADVGSAIAAAKVTVFPYLHAAGSSTLAVVSTHRTAVIASRCGCFEDYLIDGESGLLFDPGNSAQLSVLIERVLGDGSLRIGLADGLESLGSSVFDPSVVGPALARALGIRVTAPPS